MSLQQFANAFRHAVPVGASMTAGLAGRIIRGKKPSDFLTLADDPDRMIILLLGPDDLAKLPGKNGWEILMTIGYEPTYARGKVAEGCQFKLVVLEEGPSVKLATWDNTIELVGAVYPDIAPMLRRNLDGLKSTAFSEIEARAGFKFLDVEQPKDRSINKKDDPRFMTYDRLKASRGTLVDVRAFLYFTVHLRELYRGDGYTDDGKGARALREYLALNQPLSDLGVHEIIDIEVICPPEAPAVHHKNGGSTMGLIIPDKLGFMDQTLARTRYLPNLELARTEGRKARRRLGLHSAAKDKAGGKSRLAIIIDAETDFADDGRLAVPGTYDDVWRMCQRLLRGTHECEYTDLILTIDLHPPVTVHSEAWWEDQNGETPDVSLPVRMELVDPNDRFPFIGHFFNGPDRRFRPRFESKFTTTMYAPHLASTGQGPIWVFKSHCHMGTDGIQLLPPLAELVEYMATAREIQPTYMFKGQIAQVDWFGPFRPCMDVPNHPQGGLQTAYLDRIRDVRRTDVFGEAEDFCVRNGMRQVLDYFGSDRKVLESVAFVGDCTSPIIRDDPAGGNTANADFRRLMESKGVRIINHDLPFKSF